MWAVSSGSASPGRVSGRGRVLWPVSVIYPTTLDDPYSWWEDPSPADSLIDMRLGNLLMMIGAGVVVVGALVKFAPGLFSWFGNLPGDVRIEGESSRVFIPITSMIVVSVILTLVVTVIGWALRDR